MSEKTQQTVEIISPYITYFTPTITLLIGAIIGFVFSLWKDKINEDRKREKEQKELALKRLEELFTNLATLNESAFTTFNDLLSNKDRTSEISKISYNSSFIIRAFFPDIKKDYDEYMATYKSFKLVQINMFAIKTTTKSLDNGESIDFESTSKEFESKAKNLLTLIILKTKKYN